VNTYLYRCFDRDGQLLYVGITDDVDRRLRQHAVDKFWWPDVTKVTRMAFQRRTEALWAEWAVITTCHPIYNGTAAVPLTSENTIEGLLRPTRSRVAHRRHQATSGSKRPAMTDQQAVKVMLAANPQPSYAWGPREVQRLTGAGFGRIPKLISAVRAHHVRNGGVPTLTSENGYSERPDSGSADDKEQAS
jgi:hypothetical protein